MALTSENGTGMVMPVSPMGGYGYGGGGFGLGGDWAWILLLLLIGGNGFGFGGGMWPMMAGMDGGFGLYPWLNNSQNINSGFRDQMLQTTISSIGDKVTSGFGDVQNSLCAGFAGVNATVNGAANSIAQQMNANEIASLNRSFAEQTANMQGFNGVQSQIAATGGQQQMAFAEGVRDIMENCNRNNQAVLDKLCALELDGVKSQLAQAQRENTGLQNQLNMANLAASQTAQTATFQQGLNAEVDALYNRLKNCPVNTVPVAGNTPLFSCNPGFNNGGCGCNGNLGFAG